MSCTGYQADEHPQHSGPWVRSYYNMLAKRAMVLTNAAKIFLIDGRKWNRSITREKVFPLFSRTEWREIEQNDYCALCFTTYLDDKATDIINYFTALKYRIRDDRRILEGRQARFILAISPKLCERLHMDMDME